MLLLIKRVVLLSLCVSFTHISVSCVVVKMDTDEEGDNNDWDRSLESDMLETGGFIAGQLCELHYKHVKVLHKYSQYLLKVHMLAWSKCTVQCLMTALVCCQDYCNMNRLHLTVLM